MVREYGDNKESAVFTNTLHNGIFANFASWFSCRRENKCDEGTSNREN